MPGIGIGLGVGIGGDGGSGGGSGLSEAGIVRALATKGLTDAQARAAIGVAASLPAGLRAVGLIPQAQAAPTPALTPLPAGIAAMWDAASLSGLADGAAVTSWTDTVGGSIAVQTGDSGASHTYVASGGGLPAVRLSGAAVLATTGMNAANTAMTGGERGIIVVARNILGVGLGQANPCLVSSGDGTGQLFQATPTQTGRFGAMYDCADAGMRTLGYTNSDARQFAMDCVNGTAVAVGNRSGGQIAIGGWRNAGTACCGRADVLAIIIFNRALTAADFKQVHRRYCELLGQERPGGAAARNVSCLGDSLTAGYPGPATDNYPFRMAAGLGLAWGTWDALGVAGFTWTDIRLRTLPMLGTVSGATGRRGIVCVFEFANMRGSSGTQVVAAAAATMAALRAQDEGVEIVFGTSTDDGSAIGVATRQNRVDYNAHWDDPDNRAEDAAYVPIHLDPDIEVIGAAPTSGGNACYDPDGLHLLTPGYALLDAGPRGFRTAVHQRLSAP